MVRGLRTHCPNGHPYDKKNAYHRADGATTCRRCQLDRDAKRRSLRRARRPYAPPKQARARESASWHPIKDDYAAWLSAGGRSSFTVRTYCVRARLFVAWCDDQPVALAGVGVGAMSRYLAERRQQLSGNTFGGIVIALRVFFNYLTVAGVCASSPMASFPVPVVKLNPRPGYTEEHLRRLLGACRNDRDRAILLTFISTGMRLGELAGLAVEDIDFGTGITKITGKGARQRSVSLLGPALTAIREYIAGRTSGPVWLQEYNCDRPLARQSFSSILRKLAERAGVPDVHAHKFRVSFANAFLDHGGDVAKLQDVLGHSSMMMSLHYGGVNRKQRALAAQGEFATTFVTALVGEAAS